MTLVRSRDLRRTRPAGVTKLGPSVGSGALLSWLAGPRDGARLQSRFPLGLGFRALFALTLAGLAVVCATEADAEVIVEGGPSEMRVRVENGTVGQVLEALGQTVNLRYRSVASLNKVIGGSFSGPLRQVLSRVLAGFDFVVVSNPQGLELLVYGESVKNPVLPLPTEASVRPQTDSTVAEQSGPGTSLAPRYATPAGMPPRPWKFRGPTKYDLATSNLPSR
jgi:hypothetical protein